MLVNTLLVLLLVDRLAGCQWIGWLTVRAMVGGQVSRQLVSAMVGGQVGQHLDSTMVGGQVRKQLDRAMLGGQVGRHLVSAIVGGHFGRHPEMVYIRISKMAECYNL